MNSEAIDTFFILRLYRNAIFTGETELQFVF